MKEKIRIGIVGYGNIGRGVERAIRFNPDTTLGAIFTRRNPADVHPLTEGVRVLSISEAERYKNELDVLILCGGSATDLPEQGPKFAGIFNIVDSFDTHARIPEYYTEVNAAAVNGGKVAVISTGWDPGLFSIMRLYGEATLPEGSAYTFWGPGVSQGHSDAIRRIPGVKDARQYTIPIESALERVRSGEAPVLTTREKHLRKCYVVAEKDADQQKITDSIINMPHYFSDYDTHVTFISEAEMKAEHSEYPHGGFVLRSGETKEGTNHIFEFSLKLDSNPEFTANVMVAYARAAYRLNVEGQNGAKTVFDIAPAYLSPKTPAELRSEML